MRKNLFLFIGVGVLALTIPLAVFLATQDRSATLYSRAGLSGESLLYLWPAALEVPLCSLETPISSCPKKKIEIVLNTKGKLSGGVDFVAKFDPRIIRVVDAKVFPGTVDDNFNQILQVFNYYRDGEVDNRSGLMKIKSSGSFSGEKGIVATFFVSGLASGESKIEILAGDKFVDGSKVWDAREINSILGGVSGATVTVK